MIVFICYTLVPLLRHGALHPNGTWSGAIGAILEKVSARHVLGMQ